MASVRVLETLELRSARATPASRVRLGPLDQLVRWYLPITVAFVYRKVDASETVPIDRLRRALERLLEFYPQLTGRLALDVSDQALHIDHVGRSVELTVAQCDATLDECQGLADDDEPSGPARLLASKLPGGGSALVPPFGADMLDEPILAVQHTRFACGGVALGYRLRHVICDADSFFQLIHDLAQLYREICAVDQGRVDASAVTLPQPPVIDSYLREFDGEDALSYSPRLFELVSASDEQIEPVDTTEQPPPVVGRLMRFSASELAEIKREANADRADTLYSTFDSLSAHLWQCVHRARLQLCESQGMTPSEAAERVPLQFLASINVRSHLHLPPRYFQNAVLCPAHELPADTLANAPLSHIAAFVHDAVRSIDAEDARNTLRWIAAQPDKQRVQLRKLYKPSDLIITSWAKFGMYRGAELDSPPALVCSPFTPSSLVDGLVYLFPTEDQLEQSESLSGVSTGSLDVALTLSEPLWRVVDTQGQVRRHRRRG